MERLNDVVYRIQPGPRAKPKVVHRDRLWKYSGVECADWFQGPVQDKSEDVSTRTNTQQENQEGNTKGRAAVTCPEGDRTYHVDSGRTPRTRRRMIGHRGSSRTRRPKVIQQKVEKFPKIQGL